MHLPIHPPSPLFATASLLLLNLPFITASLFTISASLPGNSLDGAAINAAGFGFYTGLTGPATYCPTVVDPNCPNVTGTVVAGMSAMWVEVPGGQQIYVAPNGAISYTQAHSAFIPTGSYIGGFTNVTVTTTSSCSTPSSVTVLNWEAPDNSTKGILACPSPSSGNSTTTANRIYARTPAFNETGCVELAGLLPGYLPDGAPFGAWQYT